MPETLDLSDATFLGGTPSTFESRGTPVPFTTPDLRYARVRLGRDGGLEVLVDGFSGGRCIYVLPWAAIPDLFRLSLHDRALHAEISFSGALTPDRFRQAALRVARSGLGGAALAARGRDEAAHAARTVAAIRHHLIVRLIELTGLDVRGRALTLAYVQSPEGRAVVHEAFRRLASGIGEAPQDCLARIQDLSLLLLPIGFDQEDVRGRLRTLAGRLLAFRDAAACADLGAVSEKMADVAQETLRAGRDVLAGADRSVADIVPFLIQWDVKVRALRGALDRLSWLLDGWAPVLDLWDEAAGEGAPLPERVAGIVRLLPIVPRNEVTATQATAIAQFAHPRSRRVLPNADWRTGAIDRDLIHPSARALP